MHMDGTDAQKPDALEKYASTIVAWNTDSIVDAIEGEENRFQSPDWYFAPSCSSQHNECVLAVSFLYMYVVDRDFGFAPNPFHAVCTLATCMPRIRAKATCDDWIVGMGGRRLKATGRCVYAMRVTDTKTFDQYWTEKEFFDKRPVRNGSRLMMIGDNIYHRQGLTRDWTQVDSHHSNPDGTPNQINIKKDTSADRVLISREFFYFGRSAPAVPAEILSVLGFTNRIGPS